MAITEVPLKLKSLKSIGTKSLSCEWFFFICTMVHRFNLLSSWGSFILNQVSRMINSLSLRGTYMVQWTGSALLQIMTARLRGAKPLHQQMLGYRQLNRREKLWNTNISFQENAEKFAYTIASILFGLQCVSAASIGIDCLWQSHFACGARQLHLKVGGIRRGAH